MEASVMAEYIMAQQNGRTIPEEDTIFGVSTRANKRIAEVGKENVINGTIGALLDDDGNLMVLSSVDETFKSLTPVEYAQYAPIGGTPGFRKAVVKAALKEYKPKSQVCAVASPGGTGALRLAFSNYSQIGDQILTSDWHWGPYGKVAGEIGRSVTSFKLFDKDGHFNAADFQAEVNALAAKQETILIVLNTPAQNPTGYSMTDDDWRKAIEIISAVPKDKKIGLVADTAYIDFAGDEDEARSFLPILEDVPENVMPMLAFSLSKTFTLYGLRCGALIGFARTEEIAEEFVRVCEYSARASWSNCPKAGHSIMERIFNDPDLLARVTAERKEIRDMLLERGRAFEEAAAKEGVPMMPFSGGFFAVIPCDNPTELGLKLEEENIFLIPFGEGLRVSLAAIPIDKCRVVPAAVKKALG